MRGEPQDTAAAGAGASPAWRWGTLALLVVLHTFFTNIYPRWGNPNEFSRIYHLLAVVDRGTTRIDWYLEHYADLQDKALHEGHYYSDRPPGVVLHLLPLGWLVRTALGPHVDPPAVLLWVRLLGLSLPVAVFWWASHPYWTGLTGCARRAWGVVLAGSVGTQFFIYGTQFFGHAFAGLHLFLGFLALTHARRSPRPALFLALGGFLCALAQTCDYIVTLMIPVVTVYAAAVAGWHWRRFLAFPLGALLPVAAWMLHNWVSFGTPVAIGHQMLADPINNPYMREGWPIKGLGAPTVSALWPMAFSQFRGVVYMSPFLILTPIGWWRLAREPARRTEAIACVAAVASLALFIITLNTPWHGDWGVGVRYLTPAIPFCMVGVARALRGAGDRDWRSVVFRGGAAVGFCTVGLAAATFPLFPALFTAPIYQLAWPLFRAGQVMPSVFTGDPTAIRAAFVALLAVAAAVVVFAAWPGRRGALGGVLSLILAGVVLVLQSRAAPPVTAEMRNGIRTAAWRLGYDVGGVPLPEGPLPAPAFPRQERTAN